MAAEGLWSNGEIAEALGSRDRQSRSGATGSPSAGLKGSLMSRGPANRGRLPIALDRIAPTLPMLPSTPQRATHDYERHGTSSLYAALNVTSGQVIGSLHRRHRAIEFPKFLQRIDQNVPGHLDVHLVLDNASSHKTPKVRRWLAQHPRFHLHLTPTSSSWINLVERWFGELTTKLLRRGAHRSVHALNSDIRQWIDTWNENPQPYAWTKTADQIPDSIRRYCQRINQTGH